jgi:KUP system potassium uptake protein
MAPPSPAPAPPAAAAAAASPEGAAPSHPAHPLRASLVLGAIGVVFGDIGTSPLYTLSECLKEENGASAADPASVLGVVSLIVWSLTLVVTVKYLSFLMRADNEGEGGIMALLALVPARLRDAGPGKLGAVSLLVIVGAALLFGDGMITPAISVLSAIEGLGVATPALKAWVVPITVVILVGLFAVQRRGTGGLGTLFGPVMVAWFVTIGALGLHHVLAHPAILWSLSPVPGALMFVHHGWKSLWLLGGVVLAVTGGEALYADMGHFGARPIRIAWLALVYPALVLCYMGQAANVLAHPQLASDPFYGMLGGDRRFIYPMVILASAATVIASQALISGVFSLTHQAVRLGYFPRVAVRHTSGQAEGQIYLPLLNVILAIACVALVLVFRESSRLAAAFGLAVSGTMLITSIIYYTVVRRTWGWSALASGAVLALFLSFDLPFVVANSLKFVEGGYLPFTVGLVFTLVMASWRIGRSLLVDYFAHQPPLEGLIADLDARCLARVPGTAVVLASNTERVPPVLTRLIDRFRVTQQHTLICTVLTDHTPTVDDRERVQVSDAGHGVLRVKLRYGFMERPDVPAGVARVLADRGITTPLGEILYVLGRETLIVSARGRMGPVTEPIFAFLARNAGTASNEFGIPPEQVVEIGAQVDL